LHHTLNPAARPLRRALCIAAAGAAALLAQPAMACSTAKPAATHETWTASRYTSNGASFTIWTGPSDHGPQLEIASGPNKSLWIAASASNAVLELSTTGHATFFATPTPNSKPESLDYNGQFVWFTEFNTSCVGSISPGGVIHEYATTVSPLDSTGMAADKHGNSWFVTDFNGIGRITKTGIVKFFSFPDENTQPTAITLGPDSNMWFEEIGGPQIGKVTPFGVIKEYPAGFKNGSGGFGIAAGPTGRIWIADANNASIDASTTAGLVVHYTKGITGQPSAIVYGPDGNFYFGEYGGIVGRITPEGVITEFPLKITEGSFPVISLAVGPDKNIWFTNNGHSQVGVLHLHIK
jgi:virginiamycin B lyase